MSTDKISDRQLESFQRFLKLLPHGKDLDLIILKAHLLIEDQLRQLISERLKNPASLDDAGLGVSSVHPPRPSVISTRFSIVAVGVSCEAQQD